MNSTPMNRPNLELIENLYQSYARDPGSVDPEWRMFFAGVDFAAGGSTDGGPKGGAAKGFDQKELGVYNLIEHYRDYGHLKANLDPLGLNPPAPESFALGNFGLETKDLERTFSVGALVGRPNAALKNVIEHLEAAYCGTLTAQVADCEPPVRDWFRREFETAPPRLSLESAERKDVFEQLARTESLEKFLHTRYVGTKRFSIEGGDALVPMLERLVKRGTGMGVEEIVVGMAHRGRINVLANFMEKAIRTIFSEFDGAALEHGDYDGDVKYHLGYSSDRATPDGPCHISLAFNPSHLEAVDPVVMGMARAKQRRRGDTEHRRKVLPVLVHGDAAFAGQGVVSETLQMSKLKGYSVGGSIHVVVDNQVGFTTDPVDARSTRYASDVAKSIRAPVLLVNGDDVEATLRATEIALRFRQEFGQDIVIDLVCYRRFGHNEGDEPAFTQPVMYERIRQHPTPMAIYRDELARDGVLRAEEAEAFFKSRIDALQAILDEVRQSKPPAPRTAFGAQWKGLRRGTLEDFDTAVETKAPMDTLKRVAAVLTEAPAGVDLNPKIAKLVQARKQMAEGGHLDWAMGELLAYGSLCVEGTPVRVSGQDCKRGTFTHRQAVYYDAKTDRQYCPLATLNPAEGEFCIYNSLLSEYAVLGFEYGNSFSDPTFLTVWEAQFGDFANGAQIIIDQFLVAGEEKWARSAGLTLLLPHGYEGQGPEHSNARPERFLQMCAQGNIQVCNITTPANLFHVLRRQVKRDFRKPLVIMSPKSLLRHPKVISPWKDFTDGAFREVIGDDAVDPKRADTLVLTSGKLYYELLDAQEKSGAKGTALVRVEQLYPFPRVPLAPFLNGLPKLRRVVWAQEEPRNMGAWSYIEPKLSALLKELGRGNLEVEYAGRTERASPAVGAPRLHQREQAAILAAVFGDGPKK